jgi:hypothetical protein
MGVILREEGHKLHVFENRMLRRIFGPKSDKVTGKGKVLHHEGVWVSGCIEPRFSSSQHSLEVSGQLHALATLPQRKKPLLPIGYEVGWTPEWSG